LSSAKTRRPLRDGNGLAAASVVLAFVYLLASSRPASSQAGTSNAVVTPKPTPATSRSTPDWVTALPRQPIRVNAWPGGKKVAVCFVLYVEVWGYGHGPNFRTDMNGRNPDVVDEGFRQYAIDLGIPRVGRLFHDEAVPLSIALNAQFPMQRPDVWKRFRALVPKAPIVAHGINNSNQLLPLDRGLDAQEAYIRQTLDSIQKETGVRSTGWSSPSVYPNGDTFSATAAAGITYSLDAMDSDTLSPYHEIGAAGTDSLPGGDSRYGTIPVAREGAGRSGGHVDRLRDRAGARGRSRPPR
jgi:hypothetical protein